MAKLQGGRPYEKLGDKDPHGKFGFLFNPAGGFKVWGPLAAVVTIGLVCTFMYPAPWVGGQETYAVVFDAGSTGSRVHVYRFVQRGVFFDLKEEVFEALKPGFRAFATDPQAAADSLDPLLAKVRESVPLDKRATTPMTLRATAGLRLLPEGQDAANAIMAKVTEKLKAEGFYIADDYINILGGDLEGVYGWLCVNYLLGTLGKPWDKTVAMTDMGGGSMQMAYAVSAAVAATAPEGYIRQVSANGATYNLYIKSFLGYGIMAGRAKILQSTADPEGTHPCVPKGMAGGCVQKCYGLKPGEGYKAVAREEGADFDQCVLAATAALEKSRHCAKEGECSFAGEWGPPITAPVYAMSYFYERPAQSLATKPAHEDAKVVMKAAALAEAGPAVCSTPEADIAQRYPESEDEHRSYLCLDVAYQYALLTEGFNIAPDTDVHLIAKMPFNGKQVEAAWPLGDALEVLADVA
mmetsp:Transcript_15659/g.26391  ORF Transcript_15659/g.26391 Transcript_15659/m.26391 type:complete len:466 (-) Transcript_15659:31-1428(-)|eukprot:CAMPEP_0198229204 /NCGR_PEP_ID=MMETSP1445-20131203/114000_1 /TAXON_ID=36898 /ORGANISM="Pyramimonas sp., Strain CCMP2087" /LENGTH=465 /DNA_ID=CAMNT_0043909651 /DNA_START=28 /DNA_END=1425 /DNA_ORIENTATION=+